MAVAVKDTLVKVVEDESHMSTEEAREKFNQIITGRFATDVFE